MLTKLFVVFGAVVSLIAATTQNANAQVVDFVTHDANWLFTEDDELDDLGLLGEEESEESGNDIFSLAAFRNSDSSCECVDDCCCGPFVPNMIGGIPIGVPVQFAGGSIYHKHFSNVTVNNSPFPRDRIYFEYGYFNQTVLQRQLFSPAGREFGMHTYRLGLEKTLFEGMMSVELIVPFLFTNNSEIPSRFSSLDDRTTTEFGKLAFGTKVLICDNGRWALSGGLRVEAPTDDGITFPAEFPGFEAKNDDWLFTPYLAAVYRKDRRFLQTFAGYRIKSSDLNEEFFGTTTGTWHASPNSLLVSMSGGVWMYENPCARVVTGLAPMLELHYLTTTEPPATDGVITTATHGENTSMLNITAGLTAKVGESGTAMVGCSVPLRRSRTTILGRVVDTEGLYDWQLTTQVNFYYGRK